MWTDQQSSSKIWSQVGQSKPRLEGRPSVHEGQDGQGQCGGRPQDRTFQGKGLSQAELEEHSDGSESPFPVESWNQPAQPEAQDGHIEGSTDGQQDGVSGDEVSRYDGLTAADSLLYQRTRLKSFHISAVDQEERFSVPVVYLNSPLVQLILLIATFYSLVNIDFEILTSHSGLDSTWNWVTILFLSLFAVEILVSAIFRKQYFNSYYFYLDLISTSSMVLDLSQIQLLLKE